MLRQQIEEILETLKTKEKAVIKLRYGIDDNRERTLEEVGVLVGLTRERIRQIENKALLKLRQPTRADKIRDFYM